VGNVFKLGTRFSQAFNLKFRDENGNDHFVVMGSYGIGPSRLMGTIVEFYHDDRGIIWPEAVAPFKVNLIVLDRRFKEGEELYNRLQKNGIEVLYDDRDVSPGEKFIDADLIGCPIRLVISNKTLARKSIEIKKRSKNQIKLLTLTDILKILI